MRYNEERVEYLLAQNKTPEVVDELLNLNYGLLYRQLKKFFLLNDPDATSFGYEALYNAIMTYDHTRSNRFSTYASVCIYNRLGSHVRSLNPQSAPIIVSYDAIVGEDDYTLLHRLESSLTADGNIVDQCGVKDINNAVLYCLVQIKNPLHKRVLWVWIQSGFTKTQVKIADELNCTQTYVSQILRDFKNNLKKKLEETQ